MHCVLCDKYTYMYSIVHTAIYDIAFLILPIHLLIMKKNYLLYFSLTLFRINVFVPMIQQECVIYILVAYN